MDDTTQPRDDPDAGAPRAADVLGRARAVRPPGRSLLRPAIDATALEILAGRAGSLDALVGSLSGGDWAAPTRLGRPVGDVLAHLVGQLERTATELGAGSWVEPAADDYDHWGATEPYVARLGAGDPGPLVAALADVHARLADGLARAAGTADDLSTPLARALVKLFEHWMHADDVRLALGRPSEVPDGGTLGTMCTLAADVLPVAIAATGRDRPDAVARLVLTGRGGGVWLRRLAPGAPAPVDDEPAAVTIVAEAHRFCRLFHAQLTPAELDAHVEGDARLAADVLTAAGALAERT